MAAHYLTSFFLYTAAIVALLYGMLLYIKKSSNWSPRLGLGQSQPTGPPLRVESALDLEPRKRLYVVTYGKQRFLVSTSLEKTELLSTLEEEPVPQEALTESSQNTAVPVNGSVSGGFWERLQCSLKMVLADRFSGFGGK